MRIPSLKPGPHTLKLTFTNTEFGVLTSERTVIIEDPVVIKLQNDYALALAEGKLADASAIRKKLFARRFKRTIEPGRPIPIDKPSKPEPSTDWKAVASATWYPEKDALRVVVTVTDPDYVVLVKEGIEFGRYPVVSLHVCPTGADNDIVSFYMAPDKIGVQGEIRIGSKGAFTQFRENECVIAATWTTTPEGYIAEAKIPWSILKGLPANWTVLPVEVGIRHPQRQVVGLTMSDTSQREDLYAYGYSLLKRK